MWTMLFLVACTADPGAELPKAGITARAQLADALNQRDPVVVGPLAEQAAVWEGQDPALDRLLGDALGNVLMNAEDGLRLLRSAPSPGDSSWEEATRSAALRTGKPETIEAVWSELNQPPAPFDNPVLSQLVQRMRADTSMGSAAVVDAVFDCQLLDAQPTVGRKPLDHPALPELIEAAILMGADQVAAGRPQYRSDPDPESGRGPLQCQRKVLLTEGWPTPFSKTLTLGLRQGDRTAFIDIKLEDGQPWAYATSDVLLGDRWIRGMKALASGQGDRLKQQYPDGLWAVGKEDTP